LLNFQSLGFKFRVLKILFGDLRKKRMPWMPERTGASLQGATNGNAQNEVATPASLVDIKAAEKRILSSTEHLNEILSLVSLVNLDAGDEDTRIDVIRQAASSLTKIFRQLRKHGKLVVAEGTPADSPQEQIVRWLTDRYADFVDNVLRLLRSDDSSLQVFGFHLFRANGSWSRLPSRYV
jgi:hypothetical protein